MSALKQPDIVIHSIFQDYDADMEEVLECVTAFLDGDCGSVKDEEEVLGFMRRCLQGELRHGAYNTSFGWVHVVGDDEKIMAMPDIIYAQGTSGLSCSINTCTCSDQHSPSINPPKKK